MNDEATKMIFLHELPPDHPDRNKPLVGCKYRWKEATLLREITPSMKIAKVCYNDLAPLWTDNDVFTFDG